MTSVAATPTLPAADRAAPERARDVLAGPPLGRDEIAPMPAEMTFGDFLSALNPLHHIPVVGWVYRQITGETIQPAMRALGGLITGGPIGAIASAVGALAEELLGATDYSAPTALAGAAPAAQAAQAATQAAATTRTAAAAPPAAAPPGLVTITPPEGQPMPLAARLAARAYPTPVLPLRDAPQAAQPVTDPAAGLVPAALPVPAEPAARATPASLQPASPVAEAAAPAPAPAPASATPGRIRRAPIIPITSGGQDPAFVQRMMQGLEAYDRAMRGRATPNLPTAPPAPAAPTPAAAP
jgi:hypothetical protein